MRVGCPEILERLGEFVAAETEGDHVLIAKFGSDFCDFHGGSRSELADGVEDKICLRASSRFFALLEGVVDGGEILRDILFPQKHYADGQSDFGVNDALLVQSGGGILRELRVVVRFAEKRRGPFKEFQELRKAAQVVAGVEFIVFQKYRIFFRQGFNAVWEEHAFEVQV